MGVTHKKTTASTFGCDRPLIVRYFLIIVFFLETGESLFMPSEGWLSVVLAFKCEEDILEPAHHP